MIDKIMSFFYGKGFGKYKIIKKTYYFLKKRYYPLIKDKVKTIKFKDLKFKINVNPSRGNIEELIYYKNYFERDICNLLYKKLKKGSIYVDVGVNIGYLSIIASKIIGNKGKVIAYEPVSTTYKIANRNIKLNLDVNNIDLRKKAIGSKKGKLDIFFNETEHAKSSFYNSYEGSRKESVNVVTLDDDLKSIKVDFVKIDVEGFELEVFKGMKKLLKRDKPQVVFEYFPKYYIQNFKDWKKVTREMFKIFKDEGYTFSIVKLNGLEKIQDIDTWLENQTKGKLDIYCEFRK